MTLYSRVLATGKLHHHIHQLPCLTGGGQFWLPIGVGQTITYCHKGYTISRTPCTLQLRNDSDSSTKGGAERHFTLALNMDMWYDYLCSLKHP